ncbi:GYF domain-containing protein [Toxoplasma gondii ME49]|uniref:GYF domain-containing protein n=2 Tax=Toxoplasma gondii TaxID=5811 RepID=B9QRA2_TOXGV|nr:GYF domain-containing protein [Toxoplasma gondii ME49]EPT25493.1 GYF domain-containing protein [Toxoplasma gondii ME49]ESS28653.1 GYF domain-containing protein [Toxoplasma gondii VEG]CEL77981.1 TPA: grb10 interacting GYF protein, putative [Toxoplasma gondii VEG]|eukprot:XP_018635214.1 GYF domain-containing protein [Toxoplasma gondii ME49]
MYQPRPFTGVNRARAAAAASANQSGSSGSSTRGVRTPTASYAQQQTPAVVSSGESSTAASNLCLGSGGVLADTADFPFLVNPSRSPAAHSSAPADVASPSSQKGRRGAESGTAAEPSTPSNPWQKAGAVAQQPPRQTAPTTSSIPVSSLTGFFPGASSRAGVADSHAALQRNLQRMQLPPAPSSRNAGSTSSGRAGGAWGTASDGSGPSGEVAAGGSLEGPSSGGASGRSRGGTGGASPSPTGSRPSLGSSSSRTFAGDLFGAALRSGSRGGESKGTSEGAAASGGSLVEGPGVRAGNSGSGSAAGVEREEGVGGPSAGKENPCYGKLPLLTLWRSARSTNDAAAARVLATVAPGQVTEEQQLLFRLVVREAPAAGAGPAGAPGLGAPHHGAGQSGSGGPGRGRRPADGDWTGGGYGEGVHDSEGSEALQGHQSLRIMRGQGKGVHEEGARSGGRLGPLGLAAAFGIGSDGPPAGRGRGRGDQAFAVEESPPPGSSFSTRASVPSGTRGAVALRSGDTQPPPGGAGRGVDSPDSSFNRWRFTSEGNGSREDLGEGSGSYRGGAQAWMGAGAGGGPPKDQQLWRQPVHSPVGAKEEDANVTPTPRGGGALHHGRGSSSAGPDGHALSSEAFSGERRAGGRCGALVNSTGAGTGPAADESSKLRQHSSGAGGARGGDGFRRWGGVRGGGQGGRGPVGAAGHQGPFLEREGEKGREAETCAAGSWGVGVGRKRENQSCSRGEEGVGGDGAGAGGYGTRRARQADAAESVSSGGALLHRPGSRASVLGPEDEGVLGQETGRGATRPGSRAGGPPAAAGPRGAEAPPAAGLRKKGTDEGDWEMIRKGRRDGAGNQPASGVEAGEDEEGEGTSGVARDGDNQSRPSSSLMGDDFSRHRAQGASQSAGSGSRVLEPPPRERPSVQCGDETTAGVAATSGAGPAAGFWSDEPIIKRRHRPVAPPCVAASEVAQGEILGATGGATKAQPQGDRLTPVGPMESRVPSPRRGARAESQKKHPQPAVMSIAPSPGHRSPALTPQRSPRRAELSPRSKGAHEDEGRFEGAERDMQRGREAELSHPGEAFLAADMAASSGDSRFSRGGLSASSHEPGLATSASGDDALAPVPSYLQHLLGGVLEDALASSSEQSLSRAPAQNAGVPAGRMRPSGPALASAGGSVSHGNGNSLLPFPGAGPAGSSGVLPGIVGGGSARGGESGLPPNSAGMVAGPRGMSTGTLGAAGALLGARPGLGTGAGSVSQEQSQLLAAQKHQLLQLLHRQPQQAGDRSAGVSLLGASASASSSGHLRVPAQHPSLGVAGGERGMPASSQLPGVFRQLLGLEQQRVASEQALMQLREVAGSRGEVDPSALIQVRRLDEQAQREHLQREFFGSHHGLGQVTRTPAQGSMVGGPAPARGTEVAVHQLGSRLQPGEAGRVRSGRQSSNEQEALRGRSGMSFHSEGSCYSAQHQGERVEPRPQREDHPQKGPKFADDTPRWYYRDPSGEVQGPFPPSLMHQWWQLEFFPPLLKMRCDLSHPWLAFGDLYPLGGDEPFTTLPSPQHLARLHQQQLEMEMLHQRRLREEQERLQDQRPFLPQPSQHLLASRRTEDHASVHSIQNEHARTERGGSPGRDGSIWGRTQGPEADSRAFGGAHAHGRDVVAEARHEKFWEGASRPEEMRSAQVCIGGAATGHRSCAETLLPEDRSESSGQGSAPRLESEAFPSLAGGGSEEGRSATGKVPARRDSGEGLLPDGEREQVAAQPQGAWQSQLNLAADSKREKQEKSGRVQPETENRQKQEAKPASKVSASEEEKGSGQRERQKEKAEKAKEEATSQRGGPPAAEEVEPQTASRKAQQTQGRQTGKTGTRGEKSEGGQKAAQQSTGEAPGSKEPASGKKKQGRQAEASASSQQQKPSAKAHPSHSHASAQEQTAVQGRSTGPAQVAASGTALAGASNVSSAAPSTGKKTPGPSWRTAAGVAGPPSESLKDVMEAEQKKADELKERREEEARQKAASASAAAARKTGWAVAATSPGSGDKSAARLALSSDGSEFPDLQIAAAEGSAAGGSKKATGAAKSRGGERGTTKSLQEFVAVVNAQKREQHQNVWGQQPASILTPAPAAAGPAAASGSHRPGAAGGAQVGEKSGGRVEGNSEKETSGVRAAGADNEHGGKTKQQESGSGGKDNRSTDAVPEWYKEQVEEWKMLMEQTKLQLDLSVIEYLSTFTSEGEIVDFLAPNVEDGSQLETFARQLLSINTHFSTTRPHGKKGHGGHGNTANDYEENRVPGAPPRKSQNSEGATTKGGNSGSGRGKKKKVQGKTVDPSMLGFSVKSNRILQGTIDRGTD